MHLEHALASPALAELVRELAPHRPYCAWDKHAARVRPQAMALTAPYLQLNPPAHHAWLLIDIDRTGGATAWLDKNLPPPTYIAVNRENGHAHMGYSLAAPVCKTELARLKPLRYLAAIEHAFTEKVGGDFGFTGLLAKNPLHSQWKLWEPANAPRYELGYLAEFVDLQTCRVPKEAGVGRNCTLFDELRYWAYGAVREFWGVGRGDAWREAVRRQAEAFNTFPTPLGSAEVAGIARSVARFIWRSFTPAGFREIQAERGRLGAAVSARVKRAEHEKAILEAIESLSVEGWKPSMRSVAKAIGCSVSTLSEGYGHLWMP